MNIFKKLLIFLAFSVFAAIYIYPIFSGLVLLPLDLLVSHSNPWLLANTILLKNSYMQDSIIQMFPWKHLTYDSLRSFIIPLWNPYQFLGMPFMASMKPLVFHPSNMLFFLNEAIAWNAFLFLQLLFSGYFMYIFMRSLDTDNCGSFLSAIAFSFSSLMVCTLEFGSEGHVLLWLPMFLFLIRRYINTLSGWNILFLAIGTSISIFAGHLQYLSYIILTSITYAMYEAFRQRKLKYSIFIISGFLLGACISAVQLLPGIELYSQSYRYLTDGYDMFSSGLLKFYNFLRLISPDWLGNPTTGDLRTGYIELSGYYGIIPLFFTFYAIVRLHRTPYIRFFTVLFAIAAALSLSGVGQILYYLKIPLITGGIGGRIFFIVLFSGAVLSGIGFAGFLRNIEYKKSLKTLLLFTLIIGICIGIGLYGNKTGQVFALTIRNIKYQLIVLGIFILTSILFLRVQKHKINTIIFCIIVIGLTYFDLFRMGYRFLTFSNTKFLYPKTESVSYIKNQTQYTLGRAHGITEPEIYTYFNLYGIETYNPLYPLKTAKFLHALEGKENIILDNKYYVSQGKQLKYLFDLTGVEYIAVTKGVNPAEFYFQDSSTEKDLKKVFEDTTHDVYANTTAYPRYGLFYDIHTGIDDGKALLLIRNRTYDFSKTLVIKESIPDIISSSSGSVQLVSSDVNSQVFRVKSRSKGILYVSDVNFPGWQASVNGKITPVLTANYLFRAVKIPSGESDVRFWYYPFSFALGKWISIISIIFCVFYSAILFMKDRIKKVKENNSHASAAHKKPKFK